MALEMAMAARGGGSARRPRKLRSYETYQVNVTMYNGWDDTSSQLKVDSVDVMPARHTGQRPEVCCTSPEHLVHSTA